MIHYYIKDLVAEKPLKLELILSSIMLADSLIKALPIASFNKY